jgi:hypothetical protein
VYDTIGLYRAWQDGRLLEELGWFAARKVGEKWLEDTPAPDASPPESTPTEPPEASIPPINFDVDGITYSLNGEDAAAMEEGRRYDFPVCPPVFNIRLFISRKVPSCLGGDTPEEADFVMYREGQNFFYERKSP